MKVKKSSSAVRGTFIAVGNRGTAIAEINEVAAPLVIGRQPILTKERGEDHAQDSLWVKSCSWVQSSKATDKDGKAYFSLLEINSAIRNKAVKVLKGVQFRVTATKKVFTGDLVMTPDWKEGTKQPRTVAVINCRGYSHGRIESKMVKEQDGSEARNRHLVAKILWPKK